MHYREVLTTCAATLGDRGQKYGDSDVCFGRIAKIASVVLDKEITEYDVAMILASVKLGRIPGAPSYADNYVDLANYAAFGSHFADKKAAAPPSNVERFRGIRATANPLPRIDEMTFAAALGSVEEDVIEKNASTTDHQ